MQNPPLPPPTRKDHALDFSYWLMENCTLSEDKSVYSLDHNGEEYTNDALYEVFKIEKAVDKHFG